jgi:hypothetical protein
MREKRKPLTRDEFREQVFQRDGHKCVMCGEPAQDAHHIIERRLFQDGGYHLDNGASVCGEHHIEAEQTTLSCDVLRGRSGISSIVLPDHLYKDQEYDKWGNPILENGKRLKGELFEDESVQKILGQGGVLKDFVKYVKYPRTYHLPWSPGVSKDDRIVEGLGGFEGREVVVTVKMDGENATLYNDHIHARAIDSGGAEWRTWSKTIWSKTGWQIPEGWRVCAENLQAKHSIKYTELPSFLLMFSIWNGENVCLSWDETLEWSALLDLPLVPTLYRGKWDEKTVRGLFRERYDGNQCEGYVVRVTSSFHYKDFKRSVGKCVRAKHVATSRHWKWAKREWNELRP